MRGNFGAETSACEETSALAVQECVARAEVLLDEAAALRRELLIGSDSSDNCGCALEIVRHGIHGVRGSRYTPHVASCVSHVDFCIVCCR
jgi:hypothetical protein